METQQKFALTPVAGAIAVALAPSHQAVAQTSDVSLDEIVVTATKRSLDVQDIPASVQAITQDTLTAMGAKNMEDYSRFVPAVNVVSYGAGSNTIVFRGAITGNSYIAQSTSSVYLDEISLTTTGSQPSIRMVDIERVEALSGPQGTLYGSDAQAGTMRIITNKPQLNTFEAVADLELRGGDKSDSSYRGSLMFNIPLIDDKFAARIVAYSDRDGGFIDNVFGHTPDTSAIGGDYPTGWGSLDNSASVEENWNSADVEGARLSLLWEMNDRWSISASAMKQKTEARADNDYDPFAGDLQTVKYHKDFRNDEYEMYSFVLDGDLGFAQLVASVNYYDREAFQLIDTTVYGHYWAAAYCHDSGYTTSTPDYYDNDEDGDVTEAAYPYYWENPNTGYIVWYPVYCGGDTIEGDFLQAFFEPYAQDKTTVELRLSNQGETLDWLVGFYQEESNDFWRDDFAGPTTGGDGSVNIYQDSMSLNYMEFYYTNWVYYDEALAPDNLYYTYPDATAWWVSDSNTDWDQTAIFGEATWHINESWDLTVGGRYFDRSNTNFYRVDHPGTTTGPTGMDGEPDPADPESRAYRLANNNMAPPHSDTETEFIPKLSLSYRMSDSKMVYGLYTQGTRPGGVNRSRGEPFFSTSYTSDLMDNYEIGYRSSFGEGRGRFNATAFHMVWTDYQLSLTDPSSRPCDELDPLPDPVPDDIPNLCGQPWQSIVTNAGEAHITGLNIELDYAINDSWVFGANAMLLEAETDTTADLTGNGENDLVSGLRLPLTPEVKMSAWLDFTTPSQMMGSSEMFARLQASYTGDSMNKLDPAGLDTANPQLTNEAFTIADLRAGLRGDTWEVSVFVNNLTDERATYTYGTGQMMWAASSVQDGRAHYQQKYTNRPREFGVRFIKSWGG